MLIKPDQFKMNNSISVSLNLFNIFLQLNMKLLTEEISITSTMKLGTHPQDPDTQHPSSTFITLTQVT